MLGRRLVFTALSVSLAACALMSQKPTGSQQEQLWMLSARTAGMTACVTVREVYPERVYDLRHTIEDTVRPILDNPGPDAIERVIAMLSSSYAVPEEYMIMAFWWIRYIAGQQETVADYNTVGLAAAKEVVAGCYEAIRNFNPLGNARYLPTPDLRSLVRGHDA